MLPGMETIDAGRRPGKTVYGDLPFDVVGGPDYNLFLEIKRVA
jgi:hypothetical protein